MTEPLSMTGAPSGRTRRALDGHFAGLKLYLWSWAVATEKLALGGEAQFPSGTRPGVLGLS